MGQISDPRLDSVVVTGVRLSDDLQNAKVFYLVEDLAGSVAGDLGDSLPDDTHLEDAQLDRVLQRCTGKLRSILSKQLRMRRVPDLIFMRDESVSEGQRIEGLLRSMKGE